MGGGLMQLVAYGAQDIYLTGNPQITFWKVVYRRHTNFARESIQQTFNGSVAYGNRVTATISRNGDLLHKMYLEASVSLGATDDETFCNPGSAIVKEVEVQIGGQQIDKHYGHWMEVWAELTQPNEAHRSGVNDIAGTGGGRTKGTVFQNMSGMGGVAGADGTGGAIANLEKMFIPLQFWFCRNPGLALPLIALQYHEVKVILTFGAALDVAVAGSTLSCDLWCDYIYLDTDERRRFAQVSHEYLIEQLQYLSLTGTTMDLTLNHPVKELIWTGGTTATADINVGPSTPLAVGTGNYQLKLNGHERMAARDYRYFTRQQVYDHHTGCGGLALSDADAAQNVAADSIAVYSFALEPEEHQPSGTCNFSRIDTAQLVASSDSNSNKHNVYAVNYNVLRIMSGMGGLAYSN